MNNILLLSFFIAIVTSYAGRAVADDATQSAQTQTQQTDNQKTPPKAVSQQQSGDAKNPQQPAAFIDRDGDGIRDGKEHRFRRRASKHGKTDGRQMKQRRKQAGAQAGNASAGR